MRFFPLRKDSQALSISTELLDSAETLVLLAGSYAECQEYALVLSSQNIPNWLYDNPEGPWQLLIPCEQSENAQVQLREYFLENQHFQASIALPPLILSLQPLWVLAIPTLVTLLQFSGKIPNMDERGMNDAGAILQGEWWRVFTALTLHAGAQHLVSNLISGYFVLSLLTSRIPLSRIAPLLFLGSSFANFLVAETIRHDFYSLGFSTFVFATLGALASVELRLLPKERTLGTFKRFEPILSAGFLVMLMGLGQDTDILAHIYGFLCGIVVGLLPRKANIQGHSAPWLASDFIAVGSCYAGMLLCWIRVLRNM